MKRRGVANDSGKECDGKVKSSDDLFPDSQEIPPTSEENDESALSDSETSAAAELLKRQTPSWPHPEFTLAGKMANMVANISLDTFFSKIEVVNEENIPTEGPVILYGNHQNQFVDGMVMMRAADRPVSFVAAEVSCKKRIIGDLLQALDAVPVVRPQDRSYRGPGKLVKIDMVYRKITGSDSKFTQIEAGTMIGNKEVGIFTVDSVESDNELKYKPLPAGAMVDPGKIVDFPEYMITPKIDHAVMFEKVYESLRKGKCIGIFPEGGSHDRTELLPLKVGVAIMTLGALSQGIPVTLVPVGINYYAGHVFRSIVFVDVGKPVQISPALVQLYDRKETRKDACQQLLEEMRTALELVCVTAPDFETLKVIRTARRMYQGKVQLTPKEYIHLNQRFANAYQLWREKPQFQMLMGDIHEYLEFARSQGLKDKEVRDLPPLGSVRTLLNAVSDVVKTIILVSVILPLVLPGLLLNLPITWYSSRAIPREMKKALAGSSVKVAARDVAASQQIMIFIKTIPTLHIFYSLLWMVFFSVTWPFYAREPGTLGHLFVYNAFWFLPLCFLFLGPYYSFSFCPRVGEIVVRRWRLLPRYLLCIRSFFSSSQRNSAEALRLERKKLTVRIQDLVEELITSYPDWDKERIINRAKILKKRSRSIRQLAKNGDLLPSLPSRPSFESLGRLSFS